jgi:heme/copper-type cytochrome/quinol oxidase subunit 2
MIPGMDYESSLAGIKLAELHPNIFVAVGFHPTELDKWDDSSINKLRDLIHKEELAPLPQSKILAIGEIGLDYYWVKESDKQTRQREVLKQQLQLAQEVNKPVIIHLTSKDVIHSFKVIALRVCQDAIPGMQIPVWFKPLKEGRYQINCAQLCGAGHYSMSQGMLIVESQEKFDKWQAEQSKAPSGGSFE